MNTRIATLLLAPALTACAPPLRVTEYESKYIIDVQTLGEYATTVNRLQLKAGNRVVWEIRAKGESAQFHSIALHVGPNASAMGPVYYGEYSTVVPQESTFVMEPGRDYEVTVWGEHRWWSSRVSFRTKSNEGEPHAAS